MKSQLMTQAELARLQASGKTLEQDERGIKVTLLPDGAMLKVFRLRSWFSSSLVYSNARSFCRNAERLECLAIPTVSIVKLYHFERFADTAVLYRPLKGETIKDMLNKGSLTDDTCIKFGQFVARLHSLGIHFKSLHFGNIVLSITGDLGLIDIADMRIFPWRLWVSTRLRGFRRLVRYQVEMEMLGNQRWQLIINAYFKYCALSSNQQNFAKKSLESLYLEFKSE